MKSGSEIPTTAGRSCLFGALGSLAAQCCLWTMILVVEYKTLNRSLFQPSEGRSKHIKAGPPLCFLCFYTFPLILVVFPSLSVRSSSCSFAFRYISLGPLRVLSFLKFSVCYRPDRFRASFVCIALLASGLNLRAFGG